MGWLTRRCRRAAESWPVGDVDVYFAIAPCRRPLSIEDMTRHTLTYAAPARRAIHCLADQYQQRYHAWSASPPHQHRLSFAFLIMSLRASRRFYQLDRDYE